MDILFKDAVKIRRPDGFSVIVKPSGPSCNLDCTYCYYLDKRKLYPHETEFRMSSEVLENFTRQYIETNNSPVITFTWHGGEPTLMGLDFFRQAIELQRKFSGDKKIENAFQTNGTRLTDDWCKFFKDNDILVGISIDGEEHIHDKFRKTSAGGPTFARTMKGIELLHKHNVDFNTLSCINTYSAAYASDIYSFLKRVGSGFIQFLPVVEKDPNTGKVMEWSVKAADLGKFLIKVFDEWVRNDVSRYFVQLFDATLANYTGEFPGLCVFSETCGDALAMEHNGDLFTCDHFVYPEYLLGNIDSESMINMVESSKQFDFGIDKRNKLPQYCLKCDVLYACHGECPKHRFISTPDGETGLNFLCEGYQKFFRHAEPYMEYMANELMSKRPPANVMKWVNNRERQVFRNVVPQRNDLCPCGSGKKFKNCCAGKPLYNMH